MTAVVYHEPAGGGLGGAEVVSAAIAHALRGAGTAVRLLHHGRDLSADRLAAFADLDLTGVAVEYVPPPQKTWPAWEARPWTLGRDLRAWQADLSRGADLFAASVHGVPPFCQAKRGLLYVHFPMVDRRAVWPWDAGGGLRAALRRRWHERHWQARMDSYPVRLANSRFTAGWVGRYWGTACDVLCPPVRQDFPAVPKTDTVAVLGRFTPMKKTLELVRLFRQAFAPTHPGWGLVCVGAAGTTAEDVAYLAEVRAEADGGPVRLVVDATAGELRRTLAAAKVFWHAAGFGVDADREPHRLEHFGMATAEAMAAGCVTVVPGVGGQPEVVTDGVDGYVCRESSELPVRTSEAVADPARLAAMGHAARRRALGFARERFAAAIRRYANLGGG